MAVSTFSSHLRTVLASDRSRDDQSLLKIERAIAVEAAPKSLTSITESISKNLLKIFSAEQFKRARTLPMNAHVITDLNNAEIVTVALKAAEAKARCLIATKALKFTTLDEMMDVEEELLRISKTSGLKILGPDSFGLYTEGENLTCFPEIVEGSVALISQSSSIAQLLLTQGKACGFGFSFVAGLGQQLSVTVTDALRYLSQRQLPETVLLYLETISNAADFINVASKISASTPIIALLGGQSEAGARVAASHTNSLVIDEALMQTVLKRAGVLAVRDLREAVDVTRSVVKKAVPRGKRVAIVSHSGGINALLADQLEMQGRQIPVLPAELQEHLKRDLGEYISTVNPIDAAQNGSVQKAVKRILNSGQVDSVIICDLKPEVALKDYADNLETARKLKQPIFFYSPLDSKQLAEVLTFSSITQVAHCLKLLDQLAEERPVKKSTVKISEDSYRELSHKVLARIQTLEEEDFEGIQELLNVINIPCGSGFYAGNYPEQLSLSLSNEIGFGRVLTLEFKGKVTHAIESFDDAVIEELVNSIPRLPAAARSQLTDLAQKLVWLSLTWKDLALFSCENVLFGRDGILVTLCKFETF